MKTWIKILIVLCMMWMLISCNREQQEFTDSAIVEGYMMPSDILKVTISRQIPFIDDAVYSEDDIENLSVVITVDGVEHVLESIGEGVYVDSTYTVEAGDELELRFVFNEQSVYGYTYIPSAPSEVEISATTMTVPGFEEGGTPPTEDEMPEPVYITWENDTQDYYLMVVENLETTLDPIRDFGDEEAPENVFRKQPTNSNTEMLSPMDFQYYGSHRVILYHVLPDYSNLYDQASTTSQNLTNPSTSIENAYGIFTGLNADTLYVEVTED